MCPKAIIGLNIQHPRDIDIFNFKDKHLITDDIQTFQVIYEAKKKKNQIPFFYSYVQIILLYKGITDQPVVKNNQCRISKNVSSRFLKT